MLAELRRAQSPLIDDLKTHLAECEVFAHAAMPDVSSAITDPDRLRSLYATGLLDSPPEEVYDRITRAAANALDAPHAALSLIDVDRQFFKSTVGIGGTSAEERQTPLDRSVCQYAVANGTALVLEDARIDPVFKHHPAVVDGSVVAYLGIPLIDNGGSAVGTLCVFDTKPRMWSTGHVQVLSDLATLAAERIFASQPDSTPTNQPSAKPVAIRWPVVAANSLLRLTNRRIPTPAHIQWTRRTGPEGDEACRQTRTRSSTAHRSTPPCPAASRSLARRPQSRRHRLVEQLRNESGYVGLTVRLDIWAAFWAILIALWWTPGPAEHSKVGVLSWLFIPVLVAILSTRSMYRRSLKHSFLDEFEPVETSVAVAALTTLAIVLWQVPASASDAGVADEIRPGAMLVRLWVCAAVLVPAVRLVRSLAQRYLRRKYNFGVPALIVGSGPIAHQLVARMRQHPDYGLHPVGVLDDVRPNDIGSFHVPYLGATDALDIAARATQAQELIIAPSLGVRRSAGPNGPDGPSARHARSGGAATDGCGRAWATRVEHLGGVPLMVLCHIDPKGWQFAVKHAIGRTLAASACC